MGETVLGYSFEMKASATSMSSASKVGGSGDASFAARAFAFPCGFVVSVFDAPCDYQSAECYSGEVNEFHGVIPFSVKDNIINHRCQYGR